MNDVGDHPWSVPIKLAAAVLALSMPWPAATWAAAWDVGPAVGAKVPGIQAADLTGARVKLRDVAGKNGVVLVFFRSAKWCPYCQAQLMALKDAPRPLAERGYKTRRPLTAVLAAIDGLKR